jgi:hypothetical protein
MKEHDLIQFTERKRLRAFPAWISGAFLFMCGERQNSLDARSQARQPFGLLVHQNLCNRQG